MPEYNAVLAEQLRGVKRELSDLRAKAETVNKRITELEAAEKALTPLVGEPPKVAEKKEGK